MANVSLIERKSDGFWRIAAIFGMLTLLPALLGRSFLCR